MDVPDPDIDQVGVWCGGHVHKKRLGLHQSLYTILQVLSVTLFERMPLIQALTTTADSTVEGEGCNQLLLFDR